MSPQRVIADRSYNIERFERYLDEYKRPDYKEARVRAEHEDMPDSQDRVAVGGGGEWLGCGGRLRDGG